MDEKKYGGFTADELRDLLKGAEEAGEGLDSILCDGAIPCQIISALLDALDAA